MALHQAVRQAGAKLQWSFSSPPVSILTNATKRANFLATVRGAVEACESDGMEFDYEGPSSPAAADVFTTLLIDIKKAVCTNHTDLRECGFTILADSEPPQWSDYYRLNMSKMDGINIDFVNYMSYFAGNAGSDASRWDTSIQMLLQQGYTPSTISLTIPYYSSSGGGAWADMCSSCPDIAPELNNCSSTMFVGKMMNQRIGELAVQSGIGGVFPWMLNYDSVGTVGGCTDDSLFQWLKRGLLAKQPASA